MRYLTTLLLLMVASVAHGQIVIPDTLDPYKPMVAQVQSAGIPDGAEIKTTWQTPDSISIIQTSPTTIHLWSAPGSYKISATIVWMQFKLVTVDGQELKVLEAWDLVQHEKNIVIGDGKPVPPKPDDPPGPGPTPGIPGDEFGDLARSVNSWSRSLGQLAQVASNYKAASDRLSGRAQPIIPTIDAAVQFIAQENSKLPREQAAWEAWAAKVDPVWKTYVNDRTTAARFFELVAIGLNPSVR